MRSSTAAGQTLDQALPYIRRFRGRTFVIKYGGSAMEDPAVVDGVLRNVLLLGLVGLRVVLVHGGGKEIDRWLARLGIERRVEDGLRVTDEATMDVVEMALAGRANKALAARVTALGGLAVGLSGRDAGLLRAKPTSERLGRTGEVTAVSADLLRDLTQTGYLPIVCSVAEGPDGRAVNVNADSAAAAIAVAVRAEKLVILSDTPGVLRDPNDRATTIPSLSAEEAERLIEGGGASGGMGPKLRAALDALAGGVPAIHLLDAGEPNSLLIELFTRAGSGTMLRREGDDLSGEGGSVPLVDPGGPAV